MSIMELHAVGDSSELLSRRVRLPLPPTNNNSNNALNGHGECLGAVVNRTGYPLDPEAEGLEENPEEGSEEEADPEEEEEEEEDPEE